MVKNLHSNAGNMGSIPRLGTKVPHAEGQLSPRVATRESRRTRCNDVYLPSPYIRDNIKEQVCPPPSHGRGQGSLLLVFAPSCSQRRSPNKPLLEFFSFFLTSRQFINRKQ